MVRLWSPSRNLRVFALAFALLAMGLGPAILGGSSVAASQALPFYLSPYQGPQEAETQDDYTLVTLDAGDTLVQPFVATASGRLNAISWSRSSGNGTVTASITDGSNYPAPGDVLGSDTQTWGSDDPAFPSTTLDLYDENLPVTQGEEYVLSLTVDSGSTSIWLLGPQINPELTPDAQVLRSGSDTWLTPRPGAVWFVGMSVENYDADDPEVSATLTPSEPDGLNRWYVSPVKLTFYCSDATSWVDDCPDGSTLNYSSTIGATVHDVVGHVACSDPCQ